jgi:hypothetical protein
MYILSILSLIWLPLFMCVIYPCYGSRFGIKRTESDDDFILTNLSDCDLNTIAEYEYIHTD